MNTKYIQKVAKLGAFGDDIDTPVRIYPEAAAQSFKKDDLVYLVADAVTVCPDDPATILGKTLRDASGVTGTDIPVQVFGLLTRLAATYTDNKVTEATVATITGDPITMVKYAAGKWVLDKDTANSFANNAFFVEDLYPDDEVGDIGGRYIVGVRPSALQITAWTNEATALTLGGVPVTSSAAELNVLDGIAAGLTAAELSILDGVTATAAEINALDLSAVGAPTGITYTKHATIPIGVGTGVNAAGGVELLPAIAGKSYQMVNCRIIAVGGALAATANATGIGIYVDGGAGALLFNADLAAATQDTVVQPGDANTDVLAGGASFKANTANKNIAVKAVGGVDLITTTSFEVTVQYMLV